MDHGELPDRMDDVYVFWLVLGTSDLSRGGCSEEATVLGILRVAEELEKRFPWSAVVIQGILPRTSREDGILEPKSMHKKLIGKHHSEKYADMAQHAYLLWPSIQVINDELEKFCEEHTNIVYFDAGRLFLQDAPHDKKMGKTKKIITELMPDYVHPSPEGWKVLGDAILEEYKSIVIGDDLDTDIEGKVDDDDAR
jgi:lysophospholipase L1-like esterase